MPTEDIDRDNAALVTFFLALAMTICRLDEIPTEQRRSVVFIRALYENFEVMLKVADEEGKDIREPAEQILRDMDAALRYAAAELLMREIYNDKPSQSDI